MLCAACVSFHRRSSRSRAHILQTLDDHWVCNRVRMSAREHARRSASFLACSRFVLVMVQAKERAIGGGTEPFSMARKRVLPLMAFKLKLREQQKARARLDASYLQGWMELYRSEVRAAAQVIGQARSVEHGTRDRQTPSRPSGPRGICRSDFTIKALPCAQGELLPGLSKEGGMRLDLRLDIEETVAQMARVLVACSGQWRSSWASKWVVCGVSHDAKNKLSVRLFPASLGQYADKVKVELTQGRHTSSRACVDQTMVTEVNDAVAECLLALPMSIWIKAPVRLPPANLAQRFRLRSAALCVGIDLVCIVAHILCARDMYTDT